MTKASKTRFQNAIVGTGGVVSEIARKLNMSRQACYERLKDPALAAMLENERQATIDRCETKMLELIDKGDGAMIKFYLSTMGKSRGYTTRQEITADVSSKQPAQIIITLPDNGRDQELSKELSEGGNVVITS